MNKRQRGKACNEQSEVIMSGYGQMMIDISRQTMTTTAIRGSTVAAAAAAIIA